MVVAGLGMGLAGLGSLAWSVRSFVTDDAYISLRYARHVAEGLGPVWNRSGPRVEGYSNPLLVFAEAIGFRLGGSGPGLARWLGILAAATLVVVVWRAGRRVVGDLPALAAAAFTGLSPALAFWSVAGLETLPFSLLLAAATLELAREDGGSAARAGALLAPQPWLRPEGFLVAAVLVVASEARDLTFAGDRRRALVRSARLLGPLLVSTACLEVLRLFWFGHLLPNPVLYKIGAGTVGGVTVRFLHQSAPLAPLVLVGWAWMGRRGRLVAIPIAVYLLGSISARDSVNEFSRFLLPTFPLCLLLAAAGLANAVASPRRPAHALALVLFVALSIHQALSGGETASPRQIAAYARTYARCKTWVRTSAATWLQRHAGRADAYAIGDAGLVPFLAEGTALDIFWLNEAALGKTGRVSPRARAEWLVATAPRFVLLTSRLPSLLPHYDVERAIASNALFRRRYAPAAVIARPHCEYRLRVWRRRERAQPRT